jgi:hypothetical protein
MGARMPYAPREFSEQNRPFFSNEKRFMFSHMEMKSTNAFTGPQRYEPHKLSGSSCLVKLQKPHVARNNPNICMTMIGNSVVYSPAFESQRQRKNLIDLTQDNTFIPKAPQNPDLGMLPTPRKTRKPQSYDIGPNV